MKSHIQFYSNKQVTPHSAFKRISVEVRPASLLVVSLGKKALNGIASTFEWFTGSNWWQLVSKTKKVTSLSLGRGTLTNK